MSKIKKGAAGGQPPRDEDEGRAAGNGADPRPDLPTIGDPFTHELEGPIGDAEIRRLATELAACEDEIATLDDEKDAFSKEHNKAVKQVEAKRKDLAASVRKGTVPTEVQCVEKLDVASQRVLRIRLDTGEVFEQRAPTEADTQRALPLGEPAPVQP